MQRVGTQGPPKVAFASASLAPAPIRLHRQAAYKRHVIKETVPPGEHDAQVYSVCLRKGCGGIGLEAARKGLAQPLTQLTDRMTWPASNCHSMIQKAVAHLQMVH